jgi:ubiquinone/menaquinone biosynthesis C-methylase UbiE
MAELGGNLRDMARYDRWLGVYDCAFRLAMEGLSYGTPVRGLDVGMGAGDFIQYMVRRTGGCWIGLDRSWSVLNPFIHSVSAESVSALDGARVQAEGECLPFANYSFDIVTCIHTLHHLDPQRAIALLRECARAAKIRVVVIDLARSYVTLAGAWLLTHLTSRNRMTRADGVQSVRRAYTGHEARALAQSAGLAGARLCVRKHGPTRFSMTWQT